MKMAVVAGHRRLATTAVLGLLMLPTACAGRTEVVTDETAASPLAPATTDGAGGQRTTASPTDAPAPTTTAPPAVHPAVAPVGKATDAGIRTPDGRDRTYHVYVPSTVAARGPGGPLVPLLVALHGGFGTGTQFEANSGFDGLAEANGFIVVYPDGVGIGGGESDLAGRVWDAGGCCGSAAREQVDDVTFIRMVVDAVRSQQPVDPARTFVAGHSNGGMMAYRLACEASDVFVAAGVQSTTLVLDDCRPAHAVSLLHIHGTADENVPLDGGVGPKSISRDSYPPPLHGLDRVATADGCPAEPTTSRDPSNQDLAIWTWAPCTDGTEVRLVTVSGASHAWMGHPGPRLVGEPYQDLDASAVIWSFLIAHARTR